MSRLWWNEAILLTGHERKGNFSIPNRHKVSSYEFYRDGVAAVECQVSSSTN
jgi:hypothetical protein